MKSKSQQHHHYISSTYQKFQFLPIDRAETKTNRRCDNKTIERYGDQVILFEVIWNVLLA